jgi:hypothetical protein
VLTTTEDPEGKFFRVQGSWNSLHALRVAEMLESNKIKSINPVLLTEGDLVDVGAELDFVINRDRHARTVLKCFLTCTYVVRLISASRVQSLNLVNSFYYTLSTDLTIIRTIRQ